MASTHLTYPSTGSGTSTADGKYVRSTRFISISSGTSGVVTAPSNSTIILDDFGGTVDAIVTTSSGGFPTGTSAKTSAGVIVSSTFDVSGNYVLSGTPSAYPVILVYRVKQTLANFDSTASDIYGPVDVDLSGKADLDSPIFTTQVTLPDLVFSKNSTAPNGTDTVSVVQATGSATNIDIALNPKGNGAILVNTPDNGTTNGNKRGTNSVDLQKLRNTATQVASGNYAFQVGGYNTASAQYTGAIGYANTVYNSYAGGWGSFNVVGGASAYAFGTSNTAGASFAACFGDNNTADGINSYAFGSYANTFANRGRLSLSSGASRVTGESQSSTFMLRISLTNNTATKMTSNDAAASTNNQVILQNNQAMAFTGLIVAQRSGADESATWKIEGMAKRRANAASTVLVTSTVTAISNVVGWTTPALAADTTNGGVSITVTGVTSQNISYVARVDTVEAIYA